MSFEMWKCVLSLRVKKEETCCRNSHNSPYGLDNAKRRNVFRKANFHFHCYRSDNMGRKKKKFLILFITSTFIFLSFYLYVTRFQTAYGLLLRWQIPFTSIEPRTNINCHGDFDGKKNEQKKTNFLCHL